MKYYMRPLLVARSSQIFVNLIMEAQRSSETSDLTKDTRRNIPEDGVLHYHHRENLKSYIEFTGEAR
jgi:hypothetical protein